MKYLILFLISTSLHAEIWEPHEKELAALEWKAEQSQDAFLANKFSTIESMDYVREFNEDEAIGFQKLSSNLQQNQETPVPYHSYL